MRTLSNSFVSQIELTRGSWVAMKDRCHKSSCGAYKYYGAEGIYVYPEWRVPHTGFLKFLAYLINADIGLRTNKRLSIGRIDHSKSYVPGNILGWCTPEEQAKNKINRMGGYKVHNKKFQSIQAVADDLEVNKHGIEYSSLMHRIARRRLINQYASIDELIEEALYHENKARSGIYSKRAIKKVA